MLSIFLANIVLLLETFKLLINVAGIYAIWSYLPGRFGILFPEEI